VSERPVLTLIGKPDCHLCHVMAAIVRDALGDRVELVEADVRTRPEWAGYLMEIPVLLLGEQEVARHRTTHDGIRRRLKELGVPI
jgi:hypothetical protein